MFVDHVVERRGDGEPSAAEERPLRMPQHVNERPGHHAQPRRLRGPQQPVPVFAVAARNLLVDQTDRIEKRRTADDVRRRVCSHHAVTDEPVRGEVRDVRHAYGHTVAVVHVNTGQAHVSVVALQGTRLQLKLVRQPGIVVVAERQQVTCRRKRPGVPRPRETGRAVVDHDAHPPVACIVRERVIWFGLVVDDDRLHVTVVVLRQDRVECGAEQGRAVPRGDDDRDGRAGHQRAAFRRRLVVTGAPTIRSRRTTLTTSRTRVRRLSAQTRTRSATRATAHTVASVAPGATTTTWGKARRNVAAVATGSVLPTRYVATSPGSAW